MKTTNEIIGYRIVCERNESALNPSGRPAFIWNVPEDDGPNINILRSEEPKPISRGDAFRRLAAFLDANPLSDENDFTVEAVHRTLTAKEELAENLADQLQSLCTARGLDLGLTRHQMACQLHNELKAFTANAKNYNP